MKKVLNSSVLIDEEAALEYSSGHASESDTRIRTNIHLFKHFILEEKRLILLSFIMSLWMLLSTPLQAHASISADEKAPDYMLTKSEPIEPQTLTVSSVTANIISRDAVTVIEAPKPPPPAKKQLVSPSDLSDAQAYASSQVGGGAEWECLYNLWAKESGWRWNAENTSSGAYGIPQSLPGSKMSSAGADWQTNPKTQINWGLGYIAGRYGTPCGAWQHSVDVGWY